MNQIAVTSARHAYDGIDVVHFRGANLIFDIVQRVGHVLLVEPNAIEAAHRGNFDHARIGGIDFGATRHLAGSQNRCDPAATHPPSCFRLIFIVYRQVAPSFLIRSGFECRQ